MKEPIVNVQMTFSQLEAIEAFWSDYADESIGSDDEEENNDIHEMLRENRERLKPKRRRKQK